MAERNNFVLNISEFLQTLAADARLVGQFLMKDRN
jgi:hypothetical protein